MTACLAGSAHRDNDGKLRGGCLSRDRTTNTPGTAERGPLCDADLTHATEIGRASCRERVS